MTACKPAGPEQLQGICTDAQHHTCAALLVLQLQSEALYVLLIYRAKQQGREGAGQRGGGCVPLTGGGSLMAWREVGCTFSSPFTFLRALAATAAVSPVHLHQDTRQVRRWARFKSSSRLNKPT